MEVKFFLLLGLDVLLVDLGVVQKVLLRFTGGGVVQGFDGFLVTDAFE